ncbi:NAD(P)/FAD-dependent oxidoreductase [Lachnospiraceae bacterium 62-35]
MGKQVIIVGGGAAGLMAGIQAARRGADVTILERMDRVGKKILSTGNGKCNMTNQKLSAACYRSDNPDFPMKVISRFPLEPTLNFFSQLGILPKERDGYIYPNSQQASAVLDVLRMETERLKIHIHCQCHVRNIQKLPEGFSVLCTDRDGTSKNSAIFTGSSLILAPGSMAAPSLGSDGSGYTLAKALGHGIIKPLPALVQLICEGRDYKALAGVRSEARLKLFIDGKLTAEDKGELQITDYGISGIPVFQISRYASRALDMGQDVSVSIDFLPFMKKDELADFLFQRKKQSGNRKGEDFLTGVLNKKLAAVLLKRAGIALHEKIAQIKPNKLQELCMQIHEFQAVVTNTKPFSSAQICCGGVDTREVNSKTMESLIVPGVYFAGEILDVDGICGGYNLQWAWSSGSLAGIAAAK